MKKILWLCAALGVAFVLIGLVWTANNPPSRPIAQPPRASQMEPREIVTAYYAALNARDMETALNLLPDDVVFYTFKPNAAGRIERIEYAGIEAAQNLLEYDRSRLSRHLDQIKVNGDVVEYTLTEWLNPRIVGMNVKQPFVLHYTAQVRGGKILTITQHDSPF